MEFEKSQIIAASASSLSHPPWLELPEPLTELILERLPIDDYVIFAAVCPRWQTIQKNHRLRVGKTLPSPWLCIFPDHGKDPAPVMLCCSAFDHKFRRFPVPDTALCKRPIGSSHGWVILTSSRFASRSDPKLYSLLNPISGQHLQLPPLFSKEIPADAPISSSSSPSDPSCVFMIPTMTSVLLWRVLDPINWIELARPRPDDGTQVTTTAYYNRKFYCLCSDDTLLVVDPAPPMPIVEYLDMGRNDDQFRLNFQGDARSDHLLECNGDLLLVHLLFPSGYGGIQGAQVFKADLVRKMWVRVECLGDKALFVGSGCSFSLVAANGRVDKNCIYFNTYSQKMDDFKSRGRPSIWTGYDLGSRRVIHGPPFPNTDSLGNYRWCLLYNSSWIVPRLA